MHTCFTSPTFVETLKQKLMQLLTNLEWRYATKQFDPTKKISQEQLTFLKKAIQLSPSSYGLQLYKVLIIENPTLRATLKTHSWGQNQITEASHLVVFCNYTKVSNTEIDDFLNRTATIQNLNRDHLQGYGDFIKTKLREFTETERLNWTKRQTYLALGNLLNACAELKIDACPMEGFQVEGYNRVLELDKQNLNAAVIAPIGFRSTEDKTQHGKKVRKSFSELFISL